MEDGEQAVEAEDVEDEQTSDRSDWMDEALDGAILLTLLSCTLQLPRWMNSLIPHNFFNISRFVGEVFWLNANSTREQ